MKPSKNVIVGVVLTIVIVCGIVAYLFGRSPLGRPESATLPSLQLFTTRYALATDTNNISRLYAVEPENIKLHVTQSQFASYWQQMLTQGRIVRQTTTPQAYVLTGTTGRVTVSHRVCTSADCDGENVHEYTTEDTFVFLNGHWQLPDRTPTQDGLNAASYLYSHLPAIEQQAFRQYLSYGSDNKDVATAAYGYILDNDPTLLSHIKDWVMQNKVSGDKPIPVDQLIPAGQIDYSKQILSLNCFVTASGKSSVVRCYSAK